ncbi:MAG: hypothetical protein WC655_17905, partial [Candidatus Hydrogenedentales bacterium]
AIGWKELIERRFFPGDDLVVTLYAGEPEDGRVADRVTYSQRDIENASIDDGVLCPYVDNNNTPGNTADDYAATLNRVAGSTLWPDNTMGVDFYRSIERKHPLYMGDRFGTQNRWQATDGNYDDWSPGTNRWMPAYDINTGILTISNSRLDSALLGGTPLTSEAQTGETNGRLFGHGFSGSPLRMNFSARVLENPLFDTAGNRQFSAAGATTFNNPLVYLNPLEQPNLWSYKMAKVRNAAFASPGDLMAVPHMTLVQDLGAVVRGALGTEGLRSSSALLGRDFRGEGVLLGQDFPKDLRAVLDSATTDSLSLSVGQAEAFPLFPTRDMIVSDAKLAQWTPPTSTGATYTPPRAWAPSFLFNFAGDAATVAPVFIQNAPIPSGASEAELALRWPSALRAVMFSSSNPSSFGPTTVVREVELGNPGQTVGLTDPLDDADRPSEALFVWDGDDGLPNGQYDVHVAFTTDFTGLLEAAQGELSLFGSDLATRQDQSADFANIAVDIAVLTDTNGDRRCWLDGRGYLGPNRTPGGPDTGELGVLDATHPRPENYGMKAGLVPSTDGIVHYGVVTVENNYLALFLRNWSVPGRIPSMARVVLTPREKTVGRLNVNTAIAKDIDYTSTLSAPFNPMIGLPGILGVYTPETVVAGVVVPSTFNTRPFPDTNNINPTDAARVNAELRTEIVGAQRGQVLYPDFFDVPGTVIPVERFDGRYYLTPSELVVRGDNLPEGLRGLELYPNILSNPTETDPAKRFDEIKDRYSRIASGVTTRSDTFEIMVTAQAGVGIDGNGDGIVNWRDDTEFEVMGERKTRTIYER